MPIPRRFFILAVLLAQVPAAAKNGSAIQGWPGIAWGKGRQSTPTETDFFRIEWGPWLTGLLLMIIPAARRPWKQEIFLVSSFAAQAIPSSV